MSSDKQSRESPHNGVPMSQSDQGEIASSVLPKIESGIFQQKPCPASEGCESEVHKFPTLMKKEQDDMNQRHSPDTGSDSAAYGETETLATGSHATMSDKVSLEPKKEPVHDGVAYGETETLDTGSHATMSDKVSLEPKKELVHDGGVYASVSSKKPIPENGNSASQFNQSSVLPKKELDNIDRNMSSDATIHPSTCEKNPVPVGVHVSQFNQVSIITKVDPDSLVQGQSPDAGRNASALHDRGGTDSMMLEKSSQCMRSTTLQMCTSSSDQEKMTFSGKPEKILYKLQPRRNPDTGVNTSQSEQGIISPRVREKALDDGYNWRKYGQKLVKGNVFVRSYYKCTYSNCRAKKQVERSNDGHLTDIKYIGKHEHPKPQSSPKDTAFVSPPEMSKADIPVTATSEAENEPSAGPGDISQPSEPTETPRQLIATASNHSMGGAVSQLHNSKDDIDSDMSKRQKRETSKVDDNQVKRTYCESRQVVQMMSAVDIVNDGYRWRKYGQKLVKGNPNPRSYYRCSNAGCTVKKHVERASHDPKVVITTYEGKHDHDMPASRTVVNSTAETRSELGEHEPFGVDNVVNIGAN